MSIFSNFCWRSPQMTMIFGLMFLLLIIFVRYKKEKNITQDALGLTSLLIGLSLNLFLFNSGLTDPFLVEHVDICLISDFTLLFSSFPVSFFDGERARLRLWGRPKLSLSISVWSWSKEWCRSLPSSRGWRECRSSKTIKVVEINSRFN